MDLKCSHPNIFFSEFSEYSTDDDSSISISYIDENQPSTEGCDQSFLEQEITKLSNELIRKNLLISLNLSDDHTPLDVTYLKDMQKDYVLAEYLDSLDNINDYEGEFISMEFFNFFWVFVSHVNFLLFLFVAYE